jgi:hypothetical protein
LFIAPFGDFIALCSATWEPQGAKRRLVIGWDALLVSVGQDFLENTNIFSTSLIEECPDVRETESFK